MRNSIFIPKTINVGYQDRLGTYTGKLAYVIYYDEKGKLRKETSWNGWRDKNIPNNEYDNIPTEGFVLNKKAGDYSILQVGITDMLIVECTIHEALNLRLLSRIYYTFLKTQIVSRVRGLKENLYMDGTAKI